MEVPALPRVPAGHSALPAFLPVEAWARERTAAARAAAQARVQEAEAEAARIAAAGELALKETVLRGEKEASREIESRVRDRISETRRALNAWVDEAEQAAETILDQALDLLLGG